MFCAISGSAPEDPVVAKTSGLLFERSLIEKHLAESGKCPVTGEPLSKDDLLAVKTNKAVKPRPVTAASIPGLLSLLQNEWDAIMLEMYQLRQQLDAAKQELSHALYQHDAACRVIARQIKEMDGLRQALATAEKGIHPAAGTPAAAVANGKRAAPLPLSAAADAIPPSAAAAPLDDEPAQKKLKPGITPEMVQEMTDKSATLSKGRKKRQVSPSLASPEALEAYIQLSSNPLHKTTAPGISCLQVHPENPNTIATGGNDGNVVVFNSDSHKIMATLTGHTKKITSVKFLPGFDMLLSTSSDKTSRLFRDKSDGTGAYETAAILKEHKGEVTASSIHPTGKYFMTASTDKSWNFYDVATASCLAQVTDTSMTAGFACAAFHPDGLILGTGTAESLVRIWDVKSQTAVAKFEGHTGTVCSLSFSENGYYLATAAEDGVKLWDLRKLKNFKNIEGAGLTNVVEFDYSGLYLAVGGAELRILGTKQDWSVVKTIPDSSGSGRINDVKFGPDCKFLAVASGDRNLRLYGTPVHAASSGTNH